MRSFLGSLFRAPHARQGATSIKHPPVSPPATAPTDHLQQARHWLQEERSGNVPPDILHPDREGIEVVDTNALMDANRQIISQILDTFTDKKFIEDFDAIIVEMIRRVAHWMGPLPASRAHHHTGRGGLFTHSLSVGLGALNMSASRNVTYSSAPRNRDADNLAWQLIAFIGGLLHDIGKVNTIGRVHAFAVHPDPQGEGKFRSTSAPTYSTAWEPSVQGFAGWAKITRVRSYYIDYDGKDLLPSEDYTQRYILALVPRPLLAYIYYSNPVIRQQFEDFIRNPGSASRTPIFGVVQDADHINVSQSLDPRRKPGSIGMTSLIMRRFAEFAAEMPWNLPTSPFIYAHVQHRSDNSLRFYGLPFFVVSETTVAQLEQYILSRPMLGVSMSTHRITEHIFNALETASIMNRTVETLLPEQIAPENMADCIPASRATVRFSARQVETIAINANTPEDALISLNVIAIKVRVPAKSALDAPTLAFHEDPQPRSMAVLAATIEKGELEPADQSLRNDPSFMADFKREKARKPVDYSDLGLDKQFEETLHRAPVAPAPPPEPVLPSDKKTKLSKLASLGQLAGSGKVDLRPPLVDPQAPLWLQLFADLQDLNDVPADAAYCRAWSAIWLYLHDNPQTSATAVQTQSGHFAFKCLSLDLGLRDSLFAALNNAGLKGKILGPFWQREKITSEHPQFETLFELSKDADGKQLFRFRPEICAHLEEVVQMEGQGGAA
ncbi:TraI domain-containing protein [Paracoccus sp. T5]|uniref:TraI domain-containing protein n=1 Tax=Paracoccus sp. T5 TaxID=3402161 RepID=UPI003ADF09AF